MFNWHLSTKISPHNQPSLKSLVNSVKRSKGFSLILVPCNYGGLKSQVMVLLKQECPNIRELSLSSSAQTLYTAIEKTIDKELPESISVYGLDSVNNLEDFLSRTNLVRDKLKRDFQFPIILWVTDKVQTRMIRVVPDFYNSASVPISFKLSSAELLELLFQGSNYLFERVIDTEYELPIYDSEHQHLCQLLQELESAWDDVKKEGCTLKPELNANIYFALGRGNYEQNQIERAIDKYKFSLAFWREVYNYQKQGIVSFHLGLCYLRQAELNHSENKYYWQVADSYFKQSLDALNQEELLHFKAKFIGFRGEVLRLLEMWEELKALVQDSLKLHSVKYKSLELAKDYGFLAEIAFNYDQNDLEACRCAQKALDSLPEMSNNHQYQGKYLLTLAKAQKNIGQLSSAIDTLLQARKFSNPDNNPVLYISILETLSKLYYEGKEYQEAFYYKQELRAIENQYGFRAFIGAGCLQSPRQAKNNQHNSITVAQEIAVSGRQQDINNIIGRIESNHVPLTILHGQLGVGKSSTLKAGLIPSLQDNVLKTFDIITIFISEYTNWEKELEKQLFKQIEGRKKYSFKGINFLVKMIFSRKQEVIFAISILIQNGLYRLASLLLQDELMTNKINQNEDNKLLLVLILDQFEEFFLTHYNSNERKILFNFLSDCLKFNIVRIIVSLREDYLHYLLDWERYNNQSVIMSKILNKDIISKGLLTKENRYELQNFSVQDARNIIETLSKHSQLDLEPVLINQIVEDLAEKEKEIRPIELQVVGAQLQSDKITTLVEYQKLGENAKEKLVEKYLETVVIDCGKENESVARLVLYLLTGDNDTRPIKTYEEIGVYLGVVEKDLSKQGEKLNLVLDIFQKSGLVFLLPEISIRRYQLVHDYLVPFIRKSQPKIDELVKELETTRQELKLTKLENEIVEGKHKEIQKKLNFSEKKRKLTLILSILVTAIVVTSISFGAGLTSYMYIREGLENYNSRKLRGLPEQIRITLDILSDFSEFLLKDGEPQLALVQMLDGATTLETNYIHIEQLPDGKKTIRRVIEVLKDSINETIESKNILIPEEYSIYILQSTDGLNEEELLETLKSMVNLGCLCVPKSILKIYTRKEKVVSDRCKKLFK